jgi:hypothetical protein
MRALLYKYTCDRCHIEDMQTPGEAAAGQVLPLDWSAIALGDYSFHLCEICTPVLAKFIRENRP